MKPLSRRSVIAGSAAVVTAIPAAYRTAEALPILGRAVGKGELAALVKRYFEEIDAFNAWSSATDPDDDAFHHRAETTYDATRAQMLGLPARTADDAIAALDWLLKEGVDLGDEVLSDDYDRESNMGAYHSTVSSLINAIRGSSSRPARSRPRRCFGPGLAPAEVKRERDRLYSQRRV